MNLNGDLDLLPKGSQDRHQPINGEPAEIGLADAGEIRCHDAGYILGRAHCQIALVKHADNTCSQQRPQLFPVGVRMTEVTKDIAAASDQFGIVCHRSISFKRLSRSWIRSISCFGVLIPDFDFFWKACTTQMSSPICKA